MQVIPVTAVHRGFGTTSRRDNGGRRRSVCFSDCLFA